MARQPLTTRFSSMPMPQTGLTALTLVFCAFALFMCASHSRRWRRWSACYRGQGSEPVIQLQTEGMVFSPQAVDRQQVSGPFWQKHILMGGKCELPDFSGVIIYDPAGNVTTPAKTSRMALPWR